MKSDSRYQRRARARLPARGPVPLSQRVCHAAGHRVHKLGGRHDGVDQSIRHADVTEWIGLDTSAGIPRGVHAAQFSKTACAFGGGSRRLRAIAGSKARPPRSPMGPRQAVAWPRGPSNIAPPGPKQGSRRATRQPPVAALARPGGPFPSSRRAAGRARSGEHASPSSFTPPWAISRRPSLRLRPKSSPSRAGRWTSPSAAISASGIVLGRLVAHEEAVEVLLGSRRRRGAVETLDDPPRQLPLRLVRRGRRRRLVPQHEPVVVLHQRRPGSRISLPNISSGGSVTPT